MLEKVKLALQISTNALDSDITENIEAARAEMVRSGILPEKAESNDDPLIIKAIKTFCMKEYFNDELSERYEQSWFVQLNNLRKTKNYSVETKE